MRKLLFCLVVMVTVTVAAYSQSVQVISPNGTENWLASALKNITWKYESLPAGTLVKLVLFKGGVDQAHKVGNIVQNIPAGTNGSGSCPWTVGNYEGGTATPGPGFYIRVITMDGAFRDESNAPFTISSFVSLPRLPDLVVCLAWAGDIPYIYQDQRVKVRVKNVGQVGAPASTFEIYVKGHGDQLVQVPALAPQSEHYWSKKYDWKTCGHKTVRATADPNGQIAESNENNNMLQGSIKVSCGEIGFLLEMNRCSDQN